MCHELSYGAYANPYLSAHREKGDIFKVPDCRCLVASFASQIALPHLLFGGQGHPMHVRSVLTSVTDLICEPFAATKRCRLKEDLGTDVPDV